MKFKVTARAKAGAKHEVVTIDGKGGGYRKTPCDECPWRRDVPTGVFPPEAFRISAGTSYDMARSNFSCHMKGAKRPAICAGFLCRGANHNMSVRMAVMAGSVNTDLVSDGGFPLYSSYRKMAEANGVPHDDPALERCR